MNQNKVRDKLSDAIKKKAPGFTLNTREIAYKQIHARSCTRS